MLNFYFSLAFTKKSETQPDNALLIEDLFEVVWPFMI